MDSHTGYYCYTALGLVLLGGRPSAMDSAGNRYMLEGGHLRRITPTCFDTTFVPPSPAAQVIVPPLFPDAPPARPKPIRPAPPPPMMVKEGELPWKRPLPAPTASPLHKLPEPNPTYRSTLVHGAAPWAVWFFCIVAGATAITVLAILGAACWRDIVGY